MIPCHNESSFNLSIPQKFSVTFFHLSLPHDNEYWTHTYRLCCLFVQNKSLITPWPIRHFLNYSWKVSTTWGWWRVLVRALIFVQLYNFRYNYPSLIYLRTFFINQSVRCDEEVKKFFLRVMCHMPVIDKSMRYERIIFGMREEIV